MKKFLIALSIILLLVALYLWYELKQTKDELLMPVSWDSETISQLENELSIKAEEISGLQSENQLLKNTLSWTMDMLNSLQVEKSGVANSLSWCENKLEKYLSYIEKLVESNNLNAWNNNTNNTSNNNSSNSSTDTINWKELWKISQVYTDVNWNKKIDITYGLKLTDWAVCGAPESPICTISDDLKLGTFTVSDNVQIFTYSFNGYVDEKRVSFNSFEQKFKETNNDEYGYFKFALFRVTIENNVIVKIEEQYLP